MKRANRATTAATSPAIIKLKETLKRLKEKIKAAQAQLEALKQNHMD
ncbi:hypothetical protein [Ferrimonas sediminum]|nr:hypothetical protein [Ferrimonas sediminum]